MQPKVMLSTYYRIAYNPREPTHSLAVMQRRHTLGEGTHTHSRMHALAHKALCCSAAAYRRKRHETNSAKVSKAPGDTTRCRASGNSPHHEQCSLPLQPLQTNCSIKNAVSWV